MKIHDWTRVEPGIFHDFHTSWITHLKEGLKNVLPTGYYALAEQHLGRKQGDVLALHVSEPETQTPPPEPPPGGALAVAEAPPKVRRTMVSSRKGARRTLTIRHVSGHRIIALVEIISPSNRNSANSVKELVQKALAALNAGIHLVIVDLFPPNKFAPQGLHAEIWDQLDAEEYSLPKRKHLTLASYAAGLSTTAYVEHLAVGERMIDMPLFLTSERYVNLGLVTSYEAAFEGMPDFWQDVLEGRNPNGT